MTITTERNARTLPVLNGYVTVRDMANALVTIPMDSTLLISYQQPLELAGIYYSTLSLIVRDANDKFNSFVLWQMRSDQRLLAHPYREDRDTNKPIYQGRITAHELFNNLLGLDPEAILAMAGGAYSNGLIFGRFRSVPQGNGFPPSSQFLYNDLPLWKW